MKARAVRFVAPRAVEAGEVDVREPRDGELLVRAAFSGISGGTELLAYRGELDPDLPRDETLRSLGGTFAYPFEYGYSAVGVVEQSRASVGEGERVFAFHPHQERFVVAADDVVALDGVDERVATLLPLVETALQVSLDADVRLGERVVVVGLGPVGILSAALLARGGARVLGSEPRGWRRDAAAAFGVESVDPGELAAAVRAWTGGRGADLVVEASGAPEALAASLPLLAHEGAMLVASWYGTKPVSLPLGADFHRRRLEIRSTQVSTIPAAQSARWDRRRRRETARALLSELPIGVLATHEFPFERAAEDYDAIDRGKPGLLHAALRYSN